MTIKIWTMAQFQKLYDLQKKYGIPQEVINKAEKIIKNLDYYYGSERDADSNDGGYIFLLLPDSLEDIKNAFTILFQQHNLSPDSAECEEIIYKNGIVEWHSDLFLICTDY